MKKVFTIFCFSLMFIASQKATAQAEIDKGNVLLNAGLGFGYYYASGVPLVFSAEFAINDAISIGPYLGFTSYTERAGGYKWKYSFIDVGARGSYHFTKHLNLSTDKLDLYGTVFLGYRISNYDFDGPNGYTWDDDYPSQFTGGLTGGARWYFTDKFSVNAELGFGLAPLYTGITYKL